MNTTLSSPQMEVKLYKPLRQGEIRLLEVVPHPNGTHFRCNLRAATLAEVKQGYQTLSYIWGDLANPLEISVNDTKLAITRGLFDFLREWSRRSTTGLEYEGYRETETRNLWIDAICINQQDVDERSAQVAIMHDIYSSSKRTISWLGPSVEIHEEHLLEFESLAEAISRLQEHEPPSLAVMRTLRTTLWRRSHPAYKSEAGIENPKMGKSSEEGGTMGDNTAAWDAFARDLFQNVAETRLRISSTGMPPKRTMPPENAWMTFRNIATHEYWWRVWIRQEILLSADVVLWHGHTHSPMSRWFIIKDWLLDFTAHSKPETVDDLVWESLLNMRLDMVAYGYFLDTYENLYTPPTHLDIPGGSQSRSLSQLRYLVIGAKHARATDPRDKVFALLGLSGVTWTSAYSLSVEQAYTDLVIKAWIEVQDASFLVFAGSFHENEMHYNRPLGYRLFLPSWVPNWDMLGHQKIPGLSLMAGDASAGLPLPCMSLCDSGPVLKVKGLLVDTVTFCQWSLLETGAFIDKLIEYLYDHKHDTGRNCPGRERSRARFILSTLSQDYGWEVEIPQCQGFDSDEKRKLASSYLFLIVCLWSRTADVQRARPLRESGGSGSMFRAMFANECDGLGWTADELVTLDEWLLDPPVPLQRLQLGKLFNEPFQKLRTAVDSRQLMIVGSNHIGWAPSDAKERDSVWIVPGCPAPVVLRQVDEGHYIHLGPCYVPGLMNGEMALDVLHGNAETIEAAMRTVHLR